MLYAIAWIGVPIAFAGYVYFAYSWSLSGGSLPFLGPNEVKWWAAFVLSLALGSVCMVAARSRAVPWLWTALYVVVMAALLVGIHFGVACSRGDCF